MTRTKRGVAHDAVPAPGQQEEVEEELIDLTESLVLTSKRTQRLQKRLDKRRIRSSVENPRGLHDLPYEILLEVLSWLRPSEVFRLSRVSKALSGFIAEAEERLAKDIIHRRYRCLSECFRLPIPLKDVDEDIHPLLWNPDRQAIFEIHRRPYHHLKPPNPRIVCTCLTCLLRWNALCLAVDFAHWQPHLEKGEPLPMIPRGTRPEWNEELIGRNAQVVRNALDHPLWYAAVLETHLDSITRAVSRHSQNKGNQRARFRMNEADRLSGSDAFLEEHGPPTIDFPFHRDNYYMLEAYMPNRAWSKEHKRWMYMPAEQHDIDIAYVIGWSRKTQEGVARSLMRAGTG